MALYLDLDLSKRRGKSQAGTCRAFVVMGDMNVVLREEVLLGFRRHQASGFEEFAECVANGVDEIELLVGVSAVVISTREDFLFLGKTKFRKIFDLTNQEVRHDEIPERLPFCYGFGYVRTEFTVFITPKDLVTS